MLKLSYFTFVAFGAYASVSHNITSKTNVYNFSRMFSSR